MMDLRKNFFSETIVHHGNKLSDSVVNVSTLNTFKNRLDCEWETKVGIELSARHLQVGYCTNRTTRLALLANSTGSCIDKKY